MGLGLAAGAWLKGNDAHCLLLFVLLCPDLKDRGMLLGCLCVIEYTPGAPEQLVLVSDAQILLPVLSMSLSPVIFI